MLLEHVKFFFKVKSIFLFCLLVIVCPNVGKDAVSGKVLSFKNNEVKLPGISKFIRSPPCKKTKKQLISLTS